MMSLKDTMKSQCIMLYIISMGNWKFRVLCKHKQIFSRKLWSLGGVNNNKEPGPGPGRGRSWGRSSCQRGKQSSLSASWASTSGGGDLSEPPGNDVIRWWQQASSNIIHLLNLNSILQNNNILILFLATKNAGQYSKGIINYNYFYLNIEMKTCLSYGRNHRLRMVNWGKIWPPWGWSWRQPNSNWKMHFRSN